MNQTNTSIADRHSSREIRRKQDRKRELNQNKQPTGKEKATDRGSSSSGHGPPQQMVCTWSVRIRRVIFTVEYRTGKWFWLSTYREKVCYHHPDAQGCTVLNRLLLLLKLVNESWRFDWRFGFVEWNLAGNRDFLSFVCGVMDWFDM